MRTFVAQSSIEQTVSAIGGKLARARAERGWSLQQLADRAGVSPAAVHKIEKSGITPTIATLMKIAAALGKSVGYFVDEQDPLRPATLIRREERGALYTSKKGLSLANISGRYGPFFVAGAEATIDPGADSGRTPMAHPGEELVLVLEGELVFTVDDEVYELGSGDSLHFRTTCRHSWMNPGSQTCRAIWLAIRGS